MFPSYPEQDNALTNGDLTSAAVWAATAFQSQEPMVSVLLCVTRQSLFNNKCQEYKLNVSQRDSFGHLLPLELACLYWFWGLNPIRLIKTPMIPFEKMDQGWYI